MADTHTCPIMMELSRSIFRSPLSDSQIARRAGVGTATVWRAKSGRTLSVENVRRIAAVFHMNLSLVKETDEPTVAPAPSAE